MKRRVGWKARDRRRPVLGRPGSGWLRTRAVVVAVIMIAAGLSWAERSGWLLYRGGDWGRYHGQAFEVAHVIDGDTLDLRVRDGRFPTTRVRLWGIDTPETARLDRGRPAEPLAQEATRFVHERCAGRRVTLYLEPHRVRGTYGRVLAFVELPDGRVLNEALLAAGLARADRRFSHTWMDRYTGLERQARADGVGVWAR